MMDMTGSMVPTPVETSLAAELWTIGMIDTSWMRTYPDHFSVWPPFLEPLQLSLCLAAGLRSEELSNLRAAVVS